MGEFLLTLRPPRNTRPNRFLCLDLDFTPAPRRGRKPERKARSADRPAFQRARVFVVIVLTRRGIKRIRRRAQGCAPTRISQTMTQARCQCGHWRNSGSRERARIGRKADTGAASFTEPSLTKPWILERLDRAT